MRPPAMTAVARMAVQSGTHSRKTNASAQARAMKIIPKTYFSTAPSAVQLFDPIDQGGDVGVEREPQADEHGDRDGEHAQRRPQERVALAALQQWLVGGLARGREMIGALDLPLELGAQLIDHPHQLELAAAHAELPLKAQEQTLVVDAENVEPPAVAAKILEAQEESFAREVLVEVLEL